MLQALPGFAQKASLKTWIFSIAANLARSRAAREARTVLFDDLVAATDEEEPAVDPSRFDAAGYWHLPPRPWDDFSPERLLFSQEMRAHFQQALESLPPAQQTVLLLRDVEGFSSQEVCNILGISETNQRVLLHRARSRLRRALEPHVSGGSQQGGASA